MVLYLELITICVIGAVLQSAIGFGFPIFAMIFFTRMFPFPTAVTITQSAGILGVAYFFFKYVKQVKWNVLLPFLFSAIPIGLLCTIVSDNMPVGSLKLYLGMVLVLLSLFFLLSKGQKKLKTSKTNGVLLGGISGALNGFFAIGGPPVALYLLPSCDNDKIAYIATANAYFFLFKLVNLSLRFSNGSVQSEHIPLLAVSIISMVAGSLLGDKVMNLIPMELLKKLIYIFVGISGLVIIIQELF